MRMAKGVKIIDDSSVREIYSNRVVATSMDGAVLLVTLACGRGVPERTGERPSEPSPAVINNRLALPEGTVAEMYRILGEAMQIMLKRKVEHARTVVETMDAKVN